MKKITLLVFAAVFCFFGVSCNAGSERDSVKDVVKTSDKNVVKKKTEVTLPPASMAKKVSKATQAGVRVKVKESKKIVYYFHGNARCYSCNKIEKYTREAIEEGFSKDKIVFKPVNVEEKENKHFIKDYKLRSKSVIVQQISDEDDRDGEWKNLDKIWLLTGNKEKFIKYIRDEVEGFLIIK